MFKLIIHALHQCFRKQCFVIVMFISNSSVRIKSKVLKVLLYNAHNIIYEDFL